MTTTVMSVHELTLKHYARNPRPFDPSYDYSGRRRRNDKPTGFWVSVQGPDDWREWCEVEGYAVDALGNERDVTLSPEARILLIDNLGDLEDLTYKYPALVPERFTDDNDKYPDWATIAAEYDGIVIAPYQWPARMDLFWYYTWDCASGCIWNLGAIASVVPARVAVAS